MTARVHGMGRELVAPDWPPLTLAEVSPVLGSLGLQAHRVTWSSPRPLSAAALVQAEGRTVFVKRHARAVRTADAVAVEHAFARHLAGRGLPVPDVLGTRADGQWTHEVHAAGSGDDTYRDVPSWEPFLRVEHAVATGRLLARIADTATGFTAPARTPTLLVTSWGALSSPGLQPALDAFVQERPLLRAALAERDWRRDVEVVLAPLHARLVPHLPRLPTQWTHGDGHASNFLWRGDDISAVLDLGLSDRTTPLLDLATAIERHAISWLDPQPAVRADLVDALLAGWHAVRPLSADDRAALAALLPLVHVEFALSELAYFSGVTGSRDNAALAYSYVFDHARWFGTLAGRELLDRLLH